MKPVALICAAAVVGVAHSARISPNTYEAVIEVAEEQREASHAKQLAAQHDLDQVLAVDQVGNKVVSALSKSQNAFRPSKIAKDQPMSAAWQQMSSLVSDLQSDAEKGKMDPSVQAALAAEKEQVTKKEDTGMEYRVYEAESTLGEAEQTRRKADIERLSPLAAGQSWGDINAAEQKSAKTIISPDVRMQNWQNAESKNLDAADSLKKAPALLENLPKKKKLGAVHKDAHVNNGAKTAHVNTDSSKVWPNVMPSMQVSGDDEQLKQKPVPFKKVAPAVATPTRVTGKATAPQNKAIQEEAMRDLNVFHSDPMYQHLLGPSEDPELSAQTQQDLKLLHQALGKKWVNSEESVQPVASKPAVSNVAPKPAASKPAPRPVAHKPAAPAPEHQRIAKPAAPAPEHQPARKPVAHKPVAANPVRKFVVPPPPPPPVKPAVPQPKHVVTKAAVPQHPAAHPQHVKPVAVAHVAPRATPKQVVPKPQPPANMKQQQPPAPHVQAAAAAPKVAFRPLPAKKVQQPRPRGAKLWDPDMDANRPKKQSREDSLEARVAEEASETRAEMEQELAAPDEEFPIVNNPKVHHSFAHTTRKIPSPAPAPAPMPAVAPGAARFSEGYGTKTVPFEGNPSQGVQGQYVTHEDGKSMTKDWGTEYGEHQAAPVHEAPPPPVKGGAAAWTVSCLAMVLFVIS